MIRDGEIAVNSKAFDSTNPIYIFAIYLQITLGLTTLIWAGKKGRYIRCVAKSEVAQMCIIYPDGPLIYSF